MVKNVGRHSKILQLMSIIEPNVRRLLSHTTSPRDPINWDIIKFTNDKQNLRIYLHLEHLEVCLEDYIYCNQHGNLPDGDSEVESLQSHTV